MRNRSRTLVKVGRPRLASFLIALADVQISALTFAAVPTIKGAEIISARLVAVAPAYYYSRLDENYILNHGCDVLVIDSTQIENLASILNSVDIIEEPIANKNRLDLRRILRLRLKNGSEVEFDMERSIRDKVQSIGYSVSGENNVKVHAVNIPPQVHKSLDDWTQTNLSAVASTPANNEACRFFSLLK